MSRSRVLLGIASGLLLTAGAPLLAVLRADTCGPPPVVEVEAVCGQTLFGVGWRQPGNESDIFAEIIPDLPLELINARGAVVVSTKSDAKGQFLFRPVAAGDYVPQTTEPGFTLSWPIKVTRPFQTCNERIYIYPAAGGWPCRSRVTTARPAEIGCTVLCKAQER
jgi:hypothetical protein